MPYVTIDQVRRYLGLQAGETADDLLLEECIDAAQEIIETYTNRVFEPLTLTRNYDADIESGREHGYGVADDGVTLLLDYDLIEATAITNGDGTAVDLADVVYLPSNEYPKYAIRLTDGFWTFDDVAEQAIAITGRWGYAETPKDIVQATRRLAVFLYKQKDAQVFDSTAMFEGGVISIPEGLPASVRLILENRRRLVA